MAGTGYRVGSHCFADAQQAADYLMSQTVPVVTANGTLAHPVRQGADWYYNGHRVVLTLPHCDPNEEFNDGLYVGAQIVLMMLIAFAIKEAVRLFRRADGGSVGEE